MLLFFCLASFRKPAIIPINQILVDCLCQSRGEFSDASKGLATSKATIESSSDPLVEPAKREGIDTRGKTKQHIASDLTPKLNKKYLGDRLFLQVSSNRACKTCN